MKKHSLWWRELHSDAREGRIPSWSSSNSRRVLSCRDWHWPRVCFRSSHQYHKFPSNGHEMTRADDPYVHATFSAENHQHPARRTSISYDKIGEPVLYSLIMHKFPFDQKQYNRPMLCVQSLSISCSFVGTNRWMGVVSQIKFDRNTLAHGGLFLQIDVQQCARVRGSEIFLLRILRVVGLERYLHG